MTLYFTPPTRAGRLLAPKAKPHPFDLFKHFLPMEEAANVYLLDDGSFTENDGLGITAVKTYHGGHIHEVTDAEAAALVAAGYTDITAVTLHYGAGEYGAGLYDSLTYGG